MPSSRPRGTRHPSSGRERSIVLRGWPPVMRLYHERLRTAHQTCQTAGVEGQTQNRRSRQWRVGRIGIDRWRRPG